MTFFTANKALHIGPGNGTESLPGLTRARRDGCGVPALILILQQHTYDIATQMPELQTQVLTVPVLIAANWHSNTLRHVWSVRRAARTEGAVKCFSVKAGTLCSAGKDKGSDCYQIAFTYLLELS